MRIGIVCKVIDNFGDAGFSLRLARALVCKQHQVWLFHDNSQVFKALYPTRQNPELKMVDASNGLTLSDDGCGFDLLIEPFGTSSEHTTARFDLELKNRFANTPWVLIDYLSSEPWVENFHLSQSVDPVNGHRTTYFYPGFNQRTGGLIHCDYPKNLLRPIEKRPAAVLKVFVFAYPEAPLQELMSAVRHGTPENRQCQLYLAGDLGSAEDHPHTRRVEFCPQDEFDELLAAHDVLFVRGEDSFVRAQLAAKPLVWQIYATEDQAHAGKLLSFFRVYSEGLSAACAKALWACWASWNKLAGSDELSPCWYSVLTHLNELEAHALTWREKLLAGPELVKEVLTWRLQQTPTLPEKTDL